MTKDPTDSKWDNDKGMKDYRAFIDKYMPGVDISDTNYIFGYTQGMILEQITSSAVMIFPAKIFLSRPKI